MSKIDNNNNELNNENRAENSFFWQSIKKAVKRSFIPILILVVIDAYCEACYDYQISRVTIIAIIFVISLIHAILYILEKNERKIGKK